MAGRLTDRLVHGLSAGCAALCVALLLGVLGAFAYEWMTALARPELYDASASVGPESWTPSGSTTVATASLGAALAVLTGIGTAAWLVYAAPAGLRRWALGGLDLLAGLPTVALGLVGVVFLAPALPQGELGGLHALNASILLAVMIWPTTTALSARALEAVPLSQLRASLALGADRWQTFFRVALPSAWPGVAAGATLGLGRALGETMLLLMLFERSGGGASAGLLGGVRTLTVALAEGFAFDAGVGAGHPHLLTLVLLLFVGTLMVNLTGEALRRRQGGTA